MKLLRTARCRRPGYQSGSVHGANTEVRWLHDGFAECVQLETRPHFGERRFRCVVVGHGLKKRTSKSPPGDFGNARDFFSLIENRECLNAAFEVSVRLPGQFDFFLIA